MNSKYESSLLHLIKFAYFDQFKCVQIKYIKKCERFNHIQLKELNFSLFAFIVLTINEIVRGRARPRSPRMMYHKRYVVFPVGFMFHGWFLASRKYTPKRTNLGRRRLHSREIWNRRVQVSACELRSENIPRNTRPAQKGIYAYTI